MNADKQETIDQAEFVVDQMKLLAAEYQELVRSYGKADAQGQIARRRLDRKFRKLRGREMAAKLSELGLVDAALRLEELHKATAMVFNLVAVSIGVDEEAVLDIDVVEPHMAAIAALRRAGGT